MRKTILMLLFSVSAFSQSDKIYRIYLNDNTSIDAKKIKETEDKTNYEDLTGKAGYVFKRDLKRIQEIDINVVRNKNFEYKNGKLNDVVIVEIDSLKTNQLYERSLNFLKEYYKNPNEVIKSTIENDMIKFSGAKVDATLLSGKPLTINYSISLFFKEGKYKFELSNISLRLPATTYDYNGSDLGLKDVNYFYDKSGKLKKAYEFIPNSAESVINEIFIDLKEYILSYSKKSDW